MRFGTEQYWHEEKDFKEEEKCEHDKDMSANCKGAGWVKKKII